MYFFIPVQLVCVVIQNDINKIILAYIACFHHHTFFFSYALPYNECLINCFTTC